MMPVSFRALALSTLFLIPSAHAETAAELIKKAIDYWRGTSSYAVTEMRIHRPDWQRGMTMRVWTRGENESLVRVTAPPKDTGNATLLVKDDMWSFNPKINRVVKIPSSMMNQSWMGSDFTNNDLAKADDIVEHYTHKLLRTETQEGHKIYVIESVPKETAPVVWGREIVKVRDDWLILEHAFYDQSNVLVKRLIAQEIKQMGGKLVVARERMQRLDKPDEWTEIVTREVQFGINIPPSTFTVANLRNPRE
ncbi:MAG TPA: outer membrane lipoprotein-sorting protein [Burkholderiales bacterium]|nr:outer membrane lipoprotein-sorting protein [Burkholderiales bacterium]